MPDKEPLPDYYAILQVHPNAEPEIIEAAYRRLMCKYHPDSLSPELRSDTEILLRVRTINVAYDLLSDPVQRAAYDEARQRQISKVAPKPELPLETRILLVRCAQTNQKFRMLLGRRVGAGPRFRVLGFEPADPPAPETPGPTQPPALPARLGVSGLLDRLREQLEPRKKKSPHPDSHPPITPGYDWYSDLSFSDIEFAGWRCPACNGVSINPSAGAFQWFCCGACHRIFCAGNAHASESGISTRCPWCGRTARTITTVRPGDVWPIKGIVDTSTKANGPLQLKDSSKPSLPSKKKPGKPSLPGK